MISVRTWSLIALAVVGAGAACSPTVSDVDPLPIAGSGGSNGSTTGTGGQQIGMPSGGATSTPSGGATGAGATTGAGGSGVAPAAGGSTGAVVTCAGTGVSGGYLDNGTVCGYAWTGAFPDPGPTIDPPCGTGDCFTGDMLCASGTLTATDTEAEVYTGVMIGINAQTSADGATTATWSAAGSISVAFTAGGLTGEPRIILQSGTTDYCVPSAVSGMAYPITSFATECWGSAGTPLAAGTPIDNVIVQINGTAADEPFTDFCLTGVTNM